MLSESQVAMAVLEPRYTRDAMARAVAELFAVWGLDPAGRGSESWNPLGEWIRPGARVVIKPNWVLHQNEHPTGGMDCLITNRALIAAVLAYVLRARPARVTIGDAPLQACQFDKLRAYCELDRLAELGPGIVEIADFRRTLLARNGHAAHRREGVRGEENFVLFDLGADSLIEELPQAEGSLRVTMYNPDLLARTHAPGTHRYLIAREIIDADVVINMPKLKSHMKAGVTGALKNLIGINGNKEFLPHHRKGGSRQGGDCYEGYSFWQHCAENLYDAANRGGNGFAQTALYWSAAQSLRAARVFGHEGMVEGAWHGNQTVWRTCLDLNRVLRYGRPDGTLADQPVRRTIHITDAIIGGQGEGPLRAEPVESGFLTGALNPAAAEWVNTLAMGWDPLKIPVVREAFGRFRWPLTEFSADEIEVLTAGGARPAASITPPRGAPFRPSKGWMGHVEAEASRAAR
jgi:uncharacterized protein (DUF362 family)